MEKNLSELMREKLQLELALSEERELSEVRKKLLEKNLKEMEELYESLIQKMKELKAKDQKIRKITEELEKANKLSLLGEISQAIAHQIKNPLISIQGFAQRILNLEGGEKIKTYARIIMDEAQNLAEVLKKLLEFSRTNEPKKHLENLNGIILDTLAFFEHHLTRFKGIELRLDLTEDIPPVEVDKIHIQQVLANLLINAAQAMPNGGPITVKTGKENNRVFFAVKDEGQGIPEKIKDRIFEPFFTTKEKGDGTGLGLSICKRLVEANGGTITFFSEEGKGTTFFVHFPIGQKGNSIPS